MSIKYLKVCDDENQEPIELPTEEDGSILLSTVSAQFYGCCGLKYRHPSTQTFRGLRLADDRLYPPSDGGWSNHQYICVFPKTPKVDIGSVDRKRDNKLRCSDLIVLGLPWKTSEEGLRQYFQTFGQLLLVQIKRDSKTGSSKGFGFIKFQDYEAQIKVLGQRHLIDGRWCDVRIPNSKEGLVPKVPSKVFVGRCTENITADDLREYFTKFGQVTDVFIPKPFRAFSFVTFLDPEVAQSLCGEDHIIKGVSVNISNASPKQEHSNSKYHQPHGRPNKAHGEVMPRHSRSYQNNSSVSGNYQWGPHPHRSMETQGAGGTQGQGSNVNVPINIPVNQAIVAAALNQAAWGLVDGYQGPPTQPGPPAPRPQGFLNWMPQQQNNGGDPPAPAPAPANTWPLQPEVSAKNYVKYE